MVGAGLIGLCSLVAQAKVEAPAGKDAYAAEPLVIVKGDSTYQMQADGTGTYTRTVVARIQTESSRKQLGVISLGFAAKSQHVEWVYVRVRHQDGTVTETPVSGAIEVNQAVTREAPFYSDLKESHLPLKDLRVGDQLEWQGKVVRTVAEAPGAFWGQEWFPKDAVVLGETLRLEAPKTIAVTVWSPTNKPLETEEAGQYIWTWKYANLKATVGPDADAAKVAEKKRVRTTVEELDEREGKLPDVAWTTFPSWAAVGAWYRGLEGERIVPYAEIKAKVAQLTTGKTTQMEKVQAVYAYVATQIHYVGVAFGVGRYQPHSASDVLGNQYGDCKDKHTLLAAMLEALGVHPDAVLIGAGIRFNEAVPSPSAFNHLITRLVLDGKPLWMDTTAEVAPLGMLVYPTRDKSALVIPDTGVAVVVKTPAEVPFEQTQVMEAVGSMDKDWVSNSRISVTFRGDSDLILRGVLRSLSPAQYDELAQRLCSAMGYAGTASHAEISEVENTTIPLKISFDYKRVKGGDFEGSRILAQLAPVGLGKPDENEPPVE